MKKIILLMSILVFSSQYSIGQVDLTLNGSKPLIFTAIGTGLYNQSAIYNNTTNGFLIDLAKTSNDVNSTPIDFKIDSRGGTHKVFTIKGATGNIGIGTESPLARLHVEKGNGGLLRLSNDANNYLYSGIDGLGAYFEQVSNISSKNKIRLQTRNSNQGVYTQFYVNGENNSFNFLNGNAGIGTSEPRGLLEISGPYYGDSQLTINTTHSNGELKFSENGITKGFVWYSQGSDHMAFGRGGISTSVFVNPNGQFGIGTKNTGTHKLTVEGTIGARRVVVEANDWSDFVFEEGFELRTLEELERHISEKGHLPEIPSEDEVTENGINLGEMDAKLLQKIEELTLYMIQMNKDMTELKARNKKLEEKVQGLKMNKR